MEAATIDKNTCAQDARRDGKDGWERMELDCINIYPFPHVIFNAHYLCTDRKRGYLSRYEISDVIENF